jgi:hypothetical protein
MTSRCLRCFQSLPLPLPLLPLPLTLPLPLLLLLPLFLSLPVFLLSFRSAADESAFVFKNSPT